MNGKDTDHGFTVIVKFPSLEKIDEWYGADANQALIALRDESTDMKMTSYQAIA